MKAKQIEKLLMFAIANKLPMLLKGAAGAGKTSIILKAARAAGIKDENILIAHPVVSDPTDFKGMPSVVGGVADFLPFGDLRRICTATEPTLFFLDDLGQASIAVQAACMQLLLAREVNGHKVSDHVTFMAATNRKEDRAGVSGLLEPVKSRFQSIIEMEVNADDWVNWAVTDGNMPMELVAFIRFRPELLFQFSPTKDLTNSSSPRTVANVGKMQGLGLDKSMYFEVFKGAAGEGFAAEYCAFLEVFTKLPDMDAILKDPNGAEVPSEPSVQYATSTAIAYKMDEKNIGQFTSYLNRMPVELSFACMKDAITRNSKLVNTKHFADWAQRNGGFLF